MPGSYKNMRKGLQRAKHPQRKFGPGHKSGRLGKRGRQQRSPLAHKAMKLKRKVNYKDRRY